MKIKPDKQLLFRAALAVLAFAVCAHGFGFANLIFSGDSLGVAVSESTSAEIAAGNWLRPTYFRFRGGISAPMTVGLLSTLFMIAVCYCVCTLTGTKKTLHAAVLCGVFVLSPAVLACFCGQTQAADACFLSMALSAAGALCFFGLPFGWAAAGVLFSAAASLSFEACAFGPMLLVLVADFRKPSASGLLKGAGAVLLEAVLYTAGLLFFLRRYQAECTFRPLSGFSAGTLAQPVLSFFRPFTAYPVIDPVCVLCLLVFFVLAVWRTEGAAGLLHAVLRLAALLLLSAVPALISGKNGQTRLTDWLPAAVILLPVLRSGIRVKRIALSTSAACLCGVVFLGQTVFANQVYLKKNLEFQSTLSVMTRVVNRLEETEGFAPGKTQVAFYGAIENGPLSVSHQGFERLECFEAAGNHFGITGEGLNTAYLWQILGYPVNVLSDYDLERLRETADLPSLEAFPDRNCMRWCGKVLVIKLSD